MKKSIIFALIVSVFVSINANAQIDIVSVNWKEVEAIARQKPDSIKSLVKKLTAKELDNTMTLQQKVLAYCGQSYISKSQETAVFNDMMLARERGENDKTITMAQKVLETNPLNLTAIDAIVSTIQKMEKEKKDVSSYASIDKKHYRVVLKRILSTIAVTGEGSKDKPFQTTSISDAKDFMKLHLELDTPTSHSINTKGKSPEVIFKLKETSQYYSEKSICFDLTRIQELDGTVTTRTEL